MSVKSARADVLATFSAGGISLVDELVAAYEQEQIELAIDGAEPDVARRKVQAAREIRELLKPFPQKEQG